MTKANSLWTRNFIGLFFTQFLGAVNDNAFKVAMITLWAVTSQELPLRAEVLVVIANALFILPFVLFAKPSGYLADNFNRARLVQAVKLLECIVMVFAAILFVQGQGTFATIALLVVLFFMGTQSTLFGPVKYAILPQMMQGGSLMRANALIEGSTFVAILCGMLMGAYFIELQRTDIVAGLLVACAFLGFLSALTISAGDMQRHQSTVKTEQNFFHSLKIFLSNSQAAGITYSLAWFWSIGALLVAQLPIIAFTISDHSGIVTFFLTSLIVGIAVGNAIIAYLSTRFSAKSLLSLSVFSYLGMTVFLLDFAFVIGDMSNMRATGILDFATSGIGIHFLFVLLGLAILAGMFSVPLYTALLHISSDQNCGRNFALNNFCHAVLIIATSVLVIGLLSYFSLDEVFMIFTALHILGIPAVLFARGDSLDRVIIRLIFKLFYRVKVRGIKNYPVQQNGLLIVCNHLSYLDAPLLLGFLPRKPVFIIDSQVMKQWWVRIWLGTCTVYPVEPESPFAMKAIIKILQSGEHVVVFPEGLISHTGRLGKIYAGAGVAAHHTGCAIIGARISGLELTRFGRMENSPRRLFANAGLDITPIQYLDVPAGVHKGEKRRFIHDELSLFMREMLFQTSPFRQHIYHQLLDTARDYGLNREVVDDIQPKALTYGRLLVGSQILGQKFHRLAPKEGGVGVFLPNSKAAVTTFFALQAIDRIAVMLNFTAGLASIRAAIQLSTITSLVTSRLFIEKAELHDLIKELSADVEIVYLEDIRDQIGVIDKISTLVKVRLGFISKPTSSAQNTAVILFTSGSEGVPKGVALSHTNILANVYQALAAANFSAADRTFNPLPMFHCFGLTAGTLLPILSGARSFQFPTPLRYRQVVELIYQWRATILFGANSFLQRYGEVAAPQDLQSLRYVFAGAESLKDETYQQWFTKFGVQVMQGYGVTEASPIVAVNTRAFNNHGTVGLPVAGMHCRLIPVPEMPEANIGVLQVQGPNVMQGYIRADNPGAIEPLADGWHDTGDIVEIDQDFYIRILGRQKRFAKIAGEMISLSVVEEVASALWPEYSHAALYRAHQRKGEEIILVSENPNVQREDFVALLHNEGKSALIAPSQIQYIAEIPLLGTGKTDYVTLAKMQE